MHYNAVIVGVMVMKREFVNGRSLVRIPRVKTFNLLEKIMLIVRIVLPPSVRATGS